MNPPTSTTPPSAEAEPCLITTTGRRWNLLSPHPADVAIADIAHGLALTCRWGGQCREFYSVAQHCVLMAQEAHRRGYSLETQLWALLHDATEAYLGDVARPLKRIPELTRYRTLEHLTEGVILAAFDFVPSVAQRQLVAELDEVLLATEYRDLLPHPLSFTAEKWPVTLDAEIFGWPWGRAEHAFLGEYARLRAEIQAQDGRVAQAVEGVGHA